MTDPDRSAAAIAAAVATVPAVTVVPRRAARALPAIDGDTDTQVSITTHQDVIHVEIDIEVLAGEPAIQHARAAAAVAELATADDTAVTVRIVSVTA